MNTKNHFGWIGNLCVAAALALLMTACLEGTGNVPDPCASSGSKRAVIETKSATPSSPEELSANRDKFVERMDRLPPTAKP